MLRGSRLKRTAILALFFFSWLTLFSQVTPPQSGGEQEDKLLQGKESYQLGDYEQSIRLLEEYITLPHVPREKLAEAYYFLAKNYSAVDPEKVKDMLLKVCETDWFFNIEESDTYFKQVVDGVKREFLDNIPVNLYLQKAEAAFEKGLYDQAGYVYRVIAQKLPAKTFDQQTRQCEEARQKKQEAMDLYNSSQWEKAYIALTDVLKASPHDDRVKSAVSRIESQEILPLIKAAEEFYKTKKYKEAAPLFEKILKFMPTNQEMQARLTVCKEMTSLETSQTRPQPIEKEVPKKTKKKKFPIVPVLLGGAAVGAILFLLLKKKKEPAPTTGSIKIESDPTEAAIWLDNTNTGTTTPEVLTGITPGSHTVKLTKALYLDYEVTLNVEAGKETLLFASLTLAPTPNFVTSSDTVTVPEGGQSTFQVKLSVKPAGNINASVAWISGDTDITILSGHNLTFTETNWDTYQAVTLRAADDNDAENGQAIFRISASGVPDKDIIAVEQDRGGPGYLTVTPTSSFSSSGASGGPFSPTSKTYILENTGTGSIHWSASSSMNWVSLSDSEGTLAPGTSTAVTVSINNNANTLVVGTHSGSVTFLNTTNGGGSTTRTVTLTITSPDNPPTVNFTSPASGSTVSGTVSVQVSASDDKGVNKVELYIDSSLAATLTGSPYTYQWNTAAVSNGTHVLRAIAYDTANQTSDDQISVTVNN